MGGREEQTPGEARRGNPGPCCSAASMGGIIALEGSAATEPEARN